MYIEQWCYEGKGSHTCLSSRGFGNKRKFVKLLHFASLWFGRKINNAFVGVAFIEMKQRNSPWWSRTLAELTMEYYEKI